MGVAGRDCYTAVKGGIAAITCSMAVEFADLRPRTLPAAARQVKAGFQTTSFVSLPHCGAAFTPRLISLLRCCKPHRSRAGGLFIPLSRRGALHRLRRLTGVELPVALFDAASPLVAGNGGADMVRASSLACSGNFLLRPAICQSKHLIAKSGWGALAASWFFGPGARAPWSRCSSCLRRRSRRLG
jgi:hypothetical protein